MPSASSTVPTPPLSAETSVDQIDATRPDSNWPRGGPPVVKTLLMPITRPRSPSGVANDTQVALRDVERHGARQVVVWNEIRHECVTYGCFQGGKDG